MRSGTIPYGYAYLEGALVKNPIEFSVVLKITRLWQSGKSARAIAQILNDQKIKTRQGKTWRHTVIQSILKNKISKKENL